MLQLPQVQKLFHMLDTDGDGLLSQAEYCAYMKALNIGELQCETDRGWCNVLSFLHTTPKRGVDLVAFVLFYIKYRHSNLHDDLHNTAV